MLLLVLLGPAHQLHNHLSTVLLLVLLGPALGQPALGQAALGPPAQEPLVPFAPFSLSCPWRVCALGVAAAADVAGAQSAVVAPSCQPVEFELAHVFNAVFS